MIEIVKVEPMEPEAGALSVIHEDVAQLGAYLSQMGQMMLSMQRRLDELEEQRRQVTLSHDEVKALNRQIHEKAVEYCERYRITTPRNLRRITNGIKNAVLKRYNVTDLHDVPAVARQAAWEQVARWSDVRLMDKCRRDTGG